MVKGNCAHLIKDERFSQYRDYELPEYEKHVYHIVHETPMYLENGVKVSKPSLMKIQKFLFEIFGKKQDTLKRVVIILHDPTKVNEEEEQEVVNESINEVKKRGRKPKEVITEESINEVKKRGRKPKEVITEESINE